MQELRYKFYQIHIREFFLRTIKNRKTRRQLREGEGEINYIGDARKSRKNSLANLQVNHQMYAEASCYVVP